MQPQAKVSSLHALDGFRSSLLIYIDRAGHVLDDVHHEITRTRTWLQSDRLPHWKKQRRQREHALAQAEQELLTARLSEHPEAVRDRRLIVERLRRSLEEAEGSLRRVQQWIHQYDSEIETLAKSTVQLRHVLEHDLVKAAALLQETTGVLADYAGLSPGHAADSAARGDKTPTWPNPDPGCDPGANEGGMP